MRPYRWIVFMLAATAGAAGVLALREASLGRDAVAVEPPPAGAPNAARIPAAVAGFTGVVGCSARGCHGRSEPVKDQRVRQDEFSFVLAHDRHPHAYQALRSERGKRMAKNLGIDNAHEDARCLACHTIPQLANDASP